jgi:hypothetical protein
MSTGKMCDISLLINEWQGDVDEEEPEDEEVDEAELPTLETTAQSTASMPSSRTCKR